MNNILEWEILQPNWLTITTPIDVKHNEDDVEVITERLKLALEQNKDLPYVTANQVGYGYQMYAIRTQNNVEVWANPLMARQDDNMILVRDKEYGLENTYYCPRWTKLSVIAYSIDKGLVCNREYENEAAVILQHIMNNLNGISLKDIGLEVTQEFLDAPEDERKEVINEYVNELQKLLNTLESDIHNDSEMNQKYEAFKFVKARASNEIEAERPVKTNRKMRRWFKKLFKKKGK